MGFTPCIKPVVAGRADGACPGPTGEIEVQQRIPLFDESVTNFGESLNRKSGSGDQEFHCRFLYCRLIGYFTCCKVKAIFLTSSPSISTSVEAD